MTTRMHAAIAKRLREEAKRDDILFDTELETFTFTIKDLSKRQEKVTTKTGLRTLSDLRQLIYRTFDVPPHLQRWTIRGSSVTKDGQVKIVSIT